jgi:phosphoglycolate phosphatase-like HAD superfamily hydrolase
MKIAFDLDGTLYDTLPVFFKVNNLVRKKFNYPNITLSTYKSKFQTKDWKKFYTDLGIKEEDVEKIESEYHKIYNSMPLPELIPDAKKALSEVEQLIGHENIYIITNENSVNVERRFKKDGLAYYLDRIDTPAVGKANELHRLSSCNNNSTLFYIGDLVSDGEECKTAREMGATNLKFGAITHEYAISPKEKLIEFVSQNTKFSKVLNSLSDIKQLCNQQYSQ